MTHDPRSCRAACAAFAGCLLVVLLAGRPPSAVGQTALKAVPPGPGGPTHPTEHDCKEKSCYDVKLVDPVCIVGFCATEDIANLYWKCYPVDYESACNESPSNGSAITCGPYYCQVAYGPGGQVQRRCGFYSFYPCSTGAAIGPPVTESRP
jgi:hypothetical protein